jgi:hypothetical protein
MNIIFLSAMSWFILLDTSGLTIFLEKPIQVNTCERKLITGEDLR